MHQDEGHYGGKHPEDTVADENAAKALEPYIKDGRIGCSAAHRAAGEAGLSPEDVGRNLDLLEVRITACQLGLFGHGGKDRGKAGSCLPGNADEVAAEIEDSMAAEGLSCVELWRIAEKYGCTRLEAASVCESLDIKIRDCQLGAF